MDPDGNVFDKIITGLPTDVMILESQSALQYANGTEADVNTGIYNHHLIIADASKKPVDPIACPGSEKAPTALPMSVFMGASEANRDLVFATPDGRFNSGFYIGRTNKIILTAEIVNYSNSTQEIYSISEMEYIPGQPAGSLDVSMQVFSVTQCQKGNSQMMVDAPKGEKIFSFHSLNLTVVQDGYIIYRRE
jgi:hypothetical protein